VHVAEASARLGGRSAKAFLVHDNPSLGCTGPIPSVRDLTLENVEAMALELDEAAVNDAFGVTRPRQIDLDKIGNARRPAGQKQDAIGQLDGLFEVVRDEQGGRPRLPEYPFELAAPEKRHPG